MRQIQKAPLWVENTIKSGYPNNIVKAAFIIAGLAVTAAWMIGERQHGTSKVTFYFYMMFTAAIWSVIYCITYMWT